ncbi:acyltransferase [Spirosoma agri]|uniref:Acyltransferase family protein n=1 Tax=Spirosoma agri TaxID=1987381 RepID=A0A6M0IQZ1_9BACT|nr:acyltransferase family protein [Spirosoma agri]
MSQRNAGVDLFRLIAAFAVIFIHCIYSDKFPLLPLAGRWAVPFFFMVSGYFFQKSYSTHAKQAFLKTAQSVTILFVWANLFYLLFLGLTEGSVSSLATHFTLLVGAYFHLWFLTSLLVGYLVLWFCLTYLRQDVLPFLAVLSIILILGLNPYSFLLAMSPHPLYARLLLSIPFLCIGFLGAKYSLHRYVYTSTCWLLISFGFGLQLVEVWLLSGNQSSFRLVDFVVGTLFLSVGLFLLSLRLIVSPTCRLSYYGQRYSLPLYLYHPVVNYFLFKALVATMGIGLLYWLSPLLTAVLCLSLLLLLDKFTPGLFRILSGDFSRIAIVPSKSSSD